MSKPSLVKRLKARAKALETDTFTLYIACRDPRVPWYTKAFMGLVVAYALSPIDLIPDFIPVIGYLDDLVIVPAGIYLSLKMMPKGVLEECRCKAQNQKLSGKSKWVFAAFIIAIWLFVIYLLVKFLIGIFVS